MSRRCIVLSKYAVFFLSPLILCLEVRASDCSTIDDRRNLGDPRNQADSGWCFANAAADMISLESGHRVSSVDIASQYILGDLTALKNSSNAEVRKFLAENPTFIDRIHEERIEENRNYDRRKILTDEGLLDIGGNEDGAMLFANMKGLCEESKLPVGEAHLADLFQQIRKKHRKVVSAKASNSELSGRYDAPIGRVSDRQAQVAAHLYYQEIEKRCAPRIETAKTFIPASKTVAQDIKDYAAKVARGDLRPDEVRKELFKEIDRVLESGKVPAIGYNAYDISKLEVGVSRRDGDHSSIIAGRKMIRGECLYFVRNSFGKTCNYIDKYVKNCERSSGGVWVPAKALKSLYSVISVR